MKIKSPNWMYLAAILPLLIVDVCLGIYLARNHLWLVALLALLGVAMTAAVVRKFAVMPKPMENYGQYRQAELELPVQANVHLYWSDEMARFDFLHRVVEIVTPLFPKEKSFKVMMNPEMAKTYGETFMRIAVTRELEAMKRRTSFTAMAGLVVPIEALACCLMLVASFHFELEKALGGFVVNMAGPTVAVAIFGLCLYFWNKNISRQDLILDRTLLAHFSREEIEEYICIMEKMLEGGGKEKEFSEHYKNDRINALRCYNK